MAPVFTRSDGSEWQKSDEPISIGVAHKFRFLRTTMIVAAMAASKERPSRPAILGTASSAR
jgi:hypothetical protein